MQVVHTTAAALILLSTATALAAQEVGVIAGLGVLPVGADVSAAPVEMQLLGSLQAGRFLFRGGLAVRPRETESHDVTVVEAIGNRYGSVSAASRSGGGVPDIQVYTLVTEARFLLAGPSDRLSFPVGVRAGRVWLDTSGRRSFNGFVVGPVAGALWRLSGKLVAELSAVGQLFDLDVNPEDEFPTPELGLYGAIGVRF